MSALEEFQWRGLVFDTSEGLEQHLSSGQVTAYCGFDPTAASLHVGNLVPLLALARLQRLGHCPIALVGGGTGMIGDPSGKSQERNLLTAEKVAENIAGIRQQLAAFLDFDSQVAPAQLVDNGEWLNTIRLVDFLREIGKHFSLGAMLAKDSVKSRLDGPGISFTEFTYQMLQSYDFLVLNQRYDCTLQVGGSDQWGNITAGIDLIRRVGGTKSHALVMPLVTTAAGTKFGKTEAGAVWLDADRTSPYRFYQFWLNTADQDVIRYLRTFTFLDAEQIETLAEELATAPQKRAAQRALAHEVTALVHGESAVARAQQSSDVLFGGSFEALTAEDVLEIFDEVPSHTLTPEALTDDGLPLIGLLADAGLVASRGAARRLVREGGAYVNNQRVRDEKASVRREDFLDGRVLVLRKGQKSYHLVTLEA